MGLKELQPALTIDEQITNLKNLGLIINDEDYAVAIVGESSGKGAAKWGKLKSGAGWISLDYTKKI